MMTQPTRQLYRGNEIRFGFFFLACLSVFLILVIPNDFILINNATLLFFIVSLRILFFILCLVVSVLVIKNSDSVNYDRMLLILVSCTVLIDVFITWSRPAEYLFSFVPSFLIVSFLYFILPSTAVIKIVPAIILSAGELFFVLFVKGTPFAAKMIILLSFAGLNTIGIAGTLFTQRLRSNEMLYRNRMEDQLRFKKAIADIMFEAVLLVRERHVVDCNGLFLDLARASGLSEDEVVLTDIDHLIRFDEPSASEAYVRGENAPALLTGTVYNLPVVVRRHSVEIDGKMFTGILVRDRSDELVDVIRAEFLKTPEEQEAASVTIASLPISRREKHIVSGIIAGKSLFSIADELFIADETVKKHISIIYRKLGIRSNIELVRLVSSR